MLLAEFSIKAEGGLSAIIRAGLFYLFTHGTS
jgi:hypothetical protein